MFPNTEKIELFAIYNTICAIKTNHFKKFRKQYKEFTIQFVLLKRTYILLTSNIFLSFTIQFVLLKQLFCRALYK